jgi:hypothetical protein
MARTKKAKKGVVELMDGVREAVRNDTELRKAFVHNIPQMTLYHGNSKYRPEYCQAVIDHMSLGNSLLSFAVSLSLHPDCLYGWMKQHPEFGDAYKIARGAFQTFWERVGFQGIINQIPFFDGKTYQFMMAGWFRFGLPTDEAGDDLQRQTWEEALVKLDREESEKLLNPPPEKK